MEYLYRQSAVRSIECCIETGNYSLAQTGIDELAEFDTYAAQALQDILNEVQTK